MRPRFMSSVRARAFALSAIATLLLALAAILTSTSQADAQAATFFPLGIFEDGNVTNNPQAFETMIQDLRSRGLDTVLFTNNILRFHAPLMDVSDRLGFNVIWAPIGEMSPNYWENSGAGPDSATAQSVVAPIVDQIKSHPSVKGYNIVDEPGLHLKNKVAAATQAFKTLDPGRLVTMPLIGVDRVEPIYSAAQPTVLMLDVYPAAATNAVGDFTLRGFGYTRYDFVSYIRETTRTKPADVPLWLILQTHRFGNGTGGFDLREPTVSEVRLQQWLGIGEGAKGFFWFIYSSQQGWRGVKDNPELYSEITSLTQRVGPMRSTLSTMRRAPDQFTVTGDGNPYITTHVSTDRNHTYVVVANRDCLNARTLAVTAPGLQGQLRDIETGTLVPLGASITLAPGDGRLFEVFTSTTPSPTPVPPTPMPPTVAPTATPTPGLSIPVNTPRSAGAPQISVISTNAAPGVLQVTVNTTGTSRQSSNALQALHFTSVANAKVEVSGRVVESGNQTVVMPGSTWSTTFLVRRTQPTAASTVSFSAVDSHGAWTTLVGGGPGSF